MSKNAIEQIYDQLVQVFGGTNPNQVFSMMMPGTSLDAQNFAFDTSGAKPATVAQAESQLTNQLFDVAKVTGSSNGRRLSAQYLQALSVLVPNFNPMLPTLKKTMRDFLNAPVPANTMLDDKPFTGSLKDYYFKLFENWIATKLDWEQQIVAKRAELAKDPSTANEAFLEWYEQIAEAELAKIDEAKAKVLGVFSPADMNAILGALEAGPGGEIEEAVNVVKDIEMASPNGGYFYPVKLMPDNWFLDLASDLDPVNLLKDPEFIATSISAKRQALQASISQVQALLAVTPTSGDVKNAVDALKDAQKTYVAAQTNLLNTYTSNTATAVEMYLSKHGADARSNDTTLTELNDNASKVSTAKRDSTPDTAVKKKSDGSALTAADVDALLNGQKALIAAQSQLQTSAQGVADAGVNLASLQSQSFGQLPVILNRLQAQLADISRLQTDLSTAASSAPVSLAVGNAPTAAAPATAKRSAASERFMDLQFSFSANDMKSSSSTDTSFKQTSWSVDLFFGSAGGSSSSSSSVTAANSLEASKEIKIGLKAAKVDIDRGWFDPGVFKLSNDMSRLSSKPVAYPVPTTNDSDGNLCFDWSRANSLNDGLFACFPVGFLVVKDVNITFQASTSSLDAVHRVLDSRSAVGGGFLCFSASSSSASHSDQSSMSVKSQGNVINICMPSPQILGWFLEMTPEDKSTQLDENTKVLPTGEINIYKFVKDLAALSSGDGTADPIKKLPAVPAELRRLG